MYDNLIIYGNLFVAIVEVALAIKQIHHLLKTKYSPKLHSLHTEDKFKSMKSYNISKLSLSIFVSMFSFIKLYIVVRQFLIGRFHLKISGNNESMTSNLIFLNSIQAIDRLLSLPFDLISTFIIEQKFGFNKMTPLLFIQDYLKLEVLSAALFSIVMLFTLKFIAAYKTFYLHVFFSIAIFQLTMVIVYPIFIQPLFNKFNDLEEGDLRDKISTLANEVGFKQSKILVMDGSTRSHHSNAYFTGLFGVKRIVLFDTLLKQTDTNETLAILCHEFGHWQYGHIPQQIVLMMITLFGFIYGFNYFLKVQKEAVVVALIYFCYGINFLLKICNLVSNYITRIFERQADVYAVKLGYGEDLKSGLDKIHKENMSNLCPDRWYSVYHHSHPTLNERKMLIEEEMKKMK